MSEDRCETCRFIGRQSKSKSNLFACRRFPPTVLTVVESRDFRKDHYKGIAVWSETTSDVSLWPMTTADEWCGEHTPKGPLT